MSKYHTDCYETMKTITNIFPIEVDLPENMTKLSLDYNKPSSLNAYSDDVNEDEDSSSTEENDDELEDKKVDSLLDFN